MKNERYITTAFSDDKITLEKHLQLLCEMLEVASTSTEPVRLTQAA